MTMATPPPLDVNTKLLVFALTKFASRIFRCWLSLLGFIFCFVYRKRLVIDLNIGFFSFPKWHVVSSKWTEWSFILGFLMQCDLGFFFFFFDWSEFWFSFSAARRRGNASPTLGHGRRRSYTYGRFTFVSWFLNIFFLIRRVWICWTDHLGFVYFESVLFSDLIVRHQLKWSPQVRWRTKRLIISKWKNLRAWNSLGQLRTLRGSTQRSTILMLS